MKRKYRKYTSFTELVASVIIREFLRPICLDKVEEAVNCEDEDWEDEE